MSCATAHHNGWLSKDFLLWLASNLNLRWLRTLASAIIQLPGQLLIPLLFHTLFYFLLLRINSFYTDEYFFRGCLDKIITNIVFAIVSTILFGHPLDTRCIQELSIRYNSWKYIKHKTGHSLNFAKKKKTNDVYERTRLQIH